MHQAFDPSRSPRTPPEQQALVAAVRDGKITDESDWLEWKCEPTLDKVALAKAAKAILAFANRDPAASRHYVEGTGLFLLGVEPGGMPGIGGPELDPADLHKRIAPFCGMKIRWSATYVRVEGVAILVLLVEAPRPGDPPFPARKAAGDRAGHQILNDGAIYVRQGTETAPARAEQIDMLITRHAERRTERKLDLHVAVEPEVRAAIDLSEESMSAVIDRLVSELPAPVLHAKPEPLPEPSSRPRGLQLPDNRSAGLVARAANQRERELEQLRTRLRRSITARGVGEFEVDEDAQRKYADALVAHRESLRRELPSHLKALSRRARIAPLTIVLSNPSESTIGGVIVTLEIDLPPNSGSISADGKPSEVTVPSLPKPPSPPPTSWDEALDRRSVVAQFAIPPLGSKIPSIWLPELMRRGNVVRVEFQRLELRALEANRTLPPLSLTITDPIIRTVRVRWTATAASLSGRLQGTLEVPISENPASAEPLFAAVAPE